MHKNKLAEQYRVTRLHGISGAIPVRVRPLVLALALALSGGAAFTTHAVPNALCAGSPTADCTDVGADGIRYTSGVGAVSVGDGVAGTASVTAGPPGIELSRSGVSGAVAPDATFATIKWDTDGDPNTAQVDVVSQDGSTPHLLGYRTQSQSADAMLKQAEGWGKIRKLVFLGFFYNLVVGQPERNR